MGARVHGRVAEGHVGSTHARDSLCVAGDALTVDAMAVMLVVIVKSDAGSTARDSTSGTPLMPFARDAVTRSDVPVARP